MPLLSIRDEWECGWCSKVTVTLRALKNIGDPTTLPSGWKFIDNHSRHWKTKLEKKSDIALALGLLDAMCDECYQPILIEEENLWAKIDKLTEKLNDDTSSPPLEEKKKEFEYTKLSIKND